MEVEIVAATPDRVPELAELLGQAFSDDPIVTWPFPVASDEARASRLFAAEWPMPSTRVCRPANRARSTPRTSGSGPAR